jgi:hypothetical protein
MSYEMRKLLETVEQLNEEWVEYRDPGGHFQVVYQPPRGYFVVTQRHLPDISGESFDDVEDAIEHAHDSLGVDYLDDDVNEDFAEQPVPYDEFHMGSILDREEMPAIPMRLKALDDVPMLYMAKGDEMWVKPTNIMGEVYSEENGLTYDWDSIFHMYERGVLEIIPDENEFKEPGEMEPYVEEDVKQIGAEEINQDALVWLQERMEEQLEWVKQVKANPRQRDVEAETVAKTAIELIKFVRNHTPKKVGESALDNAVVAPLENVMRLAQEKLTDAASEFADSAEFVKRRYPEHREEYNLLVDTERELDELRRRIFEIR